MRCLIQLAGPQPLSLEQGIWVCKLCRSSFQAMARRSQAISRDRKGAPPAPRSSSTAIVDWMRVRAAGRGATLKMDLWRWCWIRCRAGGEPLPARRRRTHAGPFRCSPPVSFRPTSKPPARIWGAIHSCAEIALVLRIYLEGGAKNWPPPDVSAAACCVFPRNLERLRESLRRIQQIYLVPRHPF
jgi:hypothetical protein